jgi:hypothetical protein
MIVASALGGKIDKSTPARDRAVLNAVCRYRGESAGLSKAEVAIERAASAWRTGE